MSLTRPQAVQITYDPTGTGSTATNVQEAITDLVNKTDVYTISGVVSSGSTDVNLGQTIPVDVAVVLYLNGLRQQDDTYTIQPTKLVLTEPATADYVFTVEVNNAITTIGLSTADRNLLTEGIDAANRAESGADRAEAARDAAFVNADVFASTSEGLAGTAEGDQFQVVISDEIIRYRHDAGPIATELARYPTAVKIQNIKIQDKKFSNYRIDNYEDISRYQIERTNGTPVTGFTATEALDGFDIVSTASGRHVVVGCDFETLAGEQSFKVKAVITAINSGTVTSIGIAIGSAGPDRRQYIYRVTGQVIVIKDDESADYEIAPESAGRTFTVGDTIALKLHRKVDGSGAVTITLPDASEVSFRVSNIPEGSVWFAWRGDANATVNYIEQEFQNSMVTENIRVASLPELTAAQRLNLFAIGEFLSPLAVSTPSGFAGYTRDFSIYRRGDRTFFTSLDFDAKRPFPASAANSTLYVDVATGSDTSNGTEAAPFKSIYKAVHGRSGNIHVYVKPGVYAGNDGWRDANHTCVGLIVEPWPSTTGRIVSRRNNTALSFSLSAGQTNTYQSAIVSGGAVVDMSNVDADGDYTRLTLRSSISEVEANPNSYWVSGATVYVHTFDSRVPDSGVIVFLDSRNGRYQQDGGVVWLKGIDFEGGQRPYQQAAIVNTQSNTGYYWDCTFKYSGGSANRNGFNTDGRCLSFLRNCVAAANAADGFNYHKITGSLPPVAVEIDCVGRNNGFTGSGTNNGSTMHDGGTIIRVNGEYWNNENRNVHDVNNSYSWSLGSISRDSRGVSNRVNFAAGTGTDSTQMWLDECTSASSSWDYESAADANIYTNNCVDEGRVVAGSNVGNYTP